MGAPGPRTYPDTDLKLAREKAADARTLLAKRIDPSANRKAARDATRDSFKAMAEEFLADRRDVLPETERRDRRQLELYVYPRIGRMPIGVVTITDLLAALREVVKQGKHETAQQLRSLLSRIFRHARRATQVAGDDLRGALSAAPKTVAASLPSLSP